MNVKQRVAQHLKAIRKKKGLTQNELGLKLGIGHSVITRYESGEQNLTIETLEKIAEILEVDVSEFFLK